MAESGGWGVLPISLSFQGINAELSKQLIKPAEAAAKQAGDAIEKGVGAGAKAAAEQVSKAQYRQKKATEELGTAESKLTEQKLKTQAANQAVESAARKRAEAESKGVAAVEKAEQELLKKRAQAEKAARDLRTAEAGVEKALTESARAADNLADKQKQLDSATEGTEKSSRSLRDRLREVGQEADDTGGMFDGLAGKVGGLATAFAGIAGAGALFAEGMDISGQIDKMNLQLGTTGAAAEAMGEEVTAVMRSGFGAEEAVSAIGSLNSQFAYLGSEGEQTAAELSDNFIAFAEVFEVDMAEATQTAGQLVKNGLAGDVEEAADLMTAAMQRVPAQMRDELPEIINEYGVNFKNLGFSGEEAFGMLVAQAENGKIALDKTGDALKEFSLFAVDPAKAEVFESIGINAAEMATAVAEGGDKAQAKLQETAQALLEIEDPGLRATTAIELFGTPLEDLGVEGIPAFLEGLSGAGEGMAGFEGSSQAAADVLANSLQGRLDKAKGTVTALATDGFMVLWDVMEQQVIPAFQDTVKWVQENEAWIGPLAATIGGAAAAWGLWTGAIKAWQTVTKIAAGVQAAFNAVMAANPIMLAAMAIAGLVAGLTYFFTQTETGQRLWSEFTATLSESWDYTVEKLGAGWAWLKENVFVSWDEAVAGVKESWQYTVDTVSGAWESLTGALSAGWETIKTAVFDAWNWYVGQVQANWALVTGAITAGWNWLKDQFIAGWNTIKSFVFDAWNLAVTGVQTVFSTVTGALSASWTWLKDQLHAGWTWIDTNVFGGFRNALSSLKDFFGSIVDGIGSVWNSLRSLLAKPINFMINTVYNDGILRAWNVIADILPGLDTGSPLSGIPEHATGGRIVGPGTGTSDDVLMWGSNGEHMMTAMEVKRAGGHAHVYAMREMIASGQPFTFDGQGDLIALPRNPDNKAGDLAGAAPDLIPAFRDGGEIRPLWELQLQRGHEFAKSQHGKPYQWAGPQGVGQSFDCSGFMGSIAAAIQGTNVWQRYWATGSFSGGNTAQGFVPGLGPGFSIGLFNGGPYGGHTAGTLAPVGPYGATNVESGGSPSMVKYGIGAVGADHGSFTHQYHLPIGADGGFVSGGEGSISPEAMQEAIAKKISGAIDDILGPIADRLPSGPPAWQDIPTGVYEAGRDGLSDRAAELISGLGDKLGTVYSAVTAMGDLVRDAASGVWGWAQRAVLHDTGGVLADGGVAVNKSGKPERVLSPVQTVGFERLVFNLPLITESMAVIAKEIGEAYNGGDWGYGELAHALGNEEVAKAIVDGAAALGTISREVGPTVADAAGGYVEEQATSVLDIVGLGGLVGVAKSAAPTLVSAAANSPIRAGIGPGGVTVQVDAQGGDFVHVDDLQAAFDQIDRLRVEVTNRRPPAAMMTRGGAM